MDAVRNQLLVLVLGIIGIVATWYLLPVLLSALSAARSGADRIRKLDAEDKGAKELAKAGGTTLLTILLIVGSFGLVIILVVVPLSAGVSFANLPPVVIVRFLLNLVLGIFGMSV